MPSKRVEETRDYSQFSFLGANRDYNRGHVEKLKKAFEEVGNLTQVQPILVNEHMQIIDGQHRFVACSELGLPVFYTKQEGLGIREALSMNILHRKWGTDDYLKSYIDSGRSEYVKFKELVDDFGFSNSITLEYVGYGTGLGIGIVGGRGGLHKVFREGDLQIPQIEDVRARLQMLADMAEVTPLAYNRAFASAVSRVIANENYDHARMMRKLRTVGVKHLQGFYSVEDNLRMLETIYNNGFQAQNHVRLY